MSEEHGNRDKWFYMGVAELTEQVRKAGLIERLRPFNDVITGHEAPKGYGNPVLIDVQVDGRNCDIYHTDKKPSDTYNRIFIHIKE